VKALTLMMDFQGFLCFSNPSMRLFSITILAYLLAIVTCYSQTTRLDSLSKAHSFKDVEMGGAFVYNIDGLFLSQEKYTSLNLTPREIKKSDIFSKQEGAQLYGEKGKEGVIRISLKKIMIVNKAIVSKEEKQAKLSAIDEKEIEKISNVDGEELLSQFGIRNRYGAIVIETVVKR
jgi:hypothetical protein